MRIDGSWIGFIGLRMRSFDRVRVQRFAWHPGGISLCQSPMLGSRATARIPESNSTSTAYKDLTEARLFPMYIVTDPKPVARVRAVLSVAAKSAPISTSARRSPSSSHHSCAAAKPTSLRTLLPHVLRVARALARLRPRGTLVGQRVLALAQKRAELRWQRVGR